MPRLAAGAFPCLGLDRASHICDKLPRAMPSRLLPLSRRSILGRRLLGRRQGSQDTRRRARGSLAVGGRRADPAVPADDIACVLPRLARVADTVRRDADSIDLQGHPRRRNHLAHIPEDRQKPDAARIRARGVTCEEPQVNTNDTPPIHGIDFREDLERRLADPDLAAEFAAARDRARLGLKIARMRTQAGLTQAQLAEKLNTTQSVISRYESSDYFSYRIDTLQRLAAALGGELELDIKPREARPSVSRADE
jgi:predicted XRE-type DNA-binding protein